MVKEHYQLRLVRASFGKIEAEETYTRNGKLPDLGDVLEVIDKRYIVKVSARQTSLSNQLGYRGIAWAEIGNIEFKDLKNLKI